MSYWTLDSYACGNTWIIVEKEEKIFALLEEGALVETLNTRHFENVTTKKHSLAEDQHIPIIKTDL